MTTLKAPFPYFGGKSKIAAAVWQRFGDVKNYVEPFFGSGAMLLGRPEPFAGTETVNDLDGMVANFWRALQADPDEVAHYADWPVNENDLHARHMWLVQQKDSLAGKLEGDPDWFDAKIAGWWVWGMSCWIGSGFCTGKGPWHVVDKEDGKHLVRDDDGGNGIRRKMPHLGDGGNGIHRQMPHLGNSGNGIHRQMPHLSNGGKGIHRQRPHLSNSEMGAYMNDLADRLRKVRVTCKDWSGLVTPSVTVRHGVTGMFLDPPYGVGRDTRLYRVDSLNVAEDCRNWCLANGNQPLLRIALCGYDDVTMPDDWYCLRWKSNGGYGLQSNGIGRRNLARECVWFSPHCLSEKEGLWSHSK